MTTRKSGAKTIWTLFNAEGYVVKNGVEVQHYDDGSTRINSTLHATRDLVITENRIGSTTAGWYLER